MSMNDYLNDPDILLLSKKGPVQASYLSLVHNFTDDKVFKFDALANNTDRVLVHYGNDIYAVYKMEGGQILNKDGTLKILPHDNRSPHGQDAEGKRHVPEFMIKYNREQYKQDHEVWKNYWTWKKNRNEARGTLEEQFGYDTKHAMHLVRLLNMGEEILSSGEVNVLRPDANLLLDIRAGKWTYEEVVKFAEDKDANIREVLYKSTALPKTPDLKFAAKLLMDLQDMCWSGQINLRKVEQ